MNQQHGFRALLIKIQDLLSDNDRHRLHFLLGEDVPRTLRDDLSLSGTLRLLDSLLEKAFISDEDCDYLIAAFNNINCHDAAGRLQAYQRTRKRNDKRTFSLEDILLQDNEEEDKLTTRNMPEEIPLTVPPNILPSFPDDIYPEIYPTISSPSVRRRTNEYFGNSRWMDLICRLPLNFRERILFPPLIVIIIILAVFVFIQAIKQSPKCVSLCTNTTAVTLLRGTNVVLSPSARWSLNGTTVAGGHGWGKELNQLWSPAGLYVHDDQTVYVANQHNHSIVAWSSDAKQGQVVAGGNGEGNRLTQLNWPLDVIVDRTADALLICDGTNSRVVRWPRRDGKRGELVLPKIACWSLMMDDHGFLYVCDREKNEVRRFRMNGDLQGRLIVGGNEQGSGLNQLDSPRYLFVDRNHSVYVSDMNNHRVMKWVEDAREGLVVAGGNKPGVGVKQLIGPLGVLVDNVGAVYVSDSKNHRVMRWLEGASQGSVVAGGHGFGSAAYQLNEPVGLSFDKYGHLYVVDQGNNRVQKFKLLFE